MPDTPSIRDAYWADKLARRRSWVSRFNNVAAWFCALPVIASWLIMPVVWGGISGIPMTLTVLAVFVLIGYVTDAPDRMKRRNQYGGGPLHDRICACSYDLRGSPDSGICPECAVDYTPDSLRERWKAAVRELWPPIGERRMWRVLTWWQLALLASVPVVFLTASILPSTGDVWGTTFVSVLLAAIIGLILYITRGQDFEWRALTRRNFRTCPSCLRSLTSCPESGECPRCRLTYTPEQLRSTWTVIYRRSSVAS